MSEFSISKFMWERESAGAGTMESCYKLYTWVNHTVLMLVFQIFWKVNQITDFFKGKSLEEQKPAMMFTFSPLTKESKTRRHIRSMSDVHCSTPYRIPFRSRKGSTHEYLHSYDSDTRSRRIRSYQVRHNDSSDSSDYQDSPRKLRSLQQNILKHTDQMRIL